MEKMEEYIKEIEQIAVRGTESQSDGYSQIMRICDAMREGQRYCLGYVSKKEIEIPNEIFEKIIDNVTEFMWCNFGACHMKECSWENLREIRNYIKTEGMDKVKDI